MLYSVSEFGSLSLHFLDEAASGGKKVIQGIRLNARKELLMKPLKDQATLDLTWINDPLTDNDAGPFGGFKMSSIGRELGEEGLDEFRETKHVHWD